MTGTEPSTQLNLLGIYGAVTGTLSLAVAAFAMLQTLIVRGRVEMTRPTYVVFVNKLNGDGAKIYLRGLLHSSTKRGRVVENMYVELRRGETRQRFNVWSHRGGDRLTRGSGLYVGLEGVSNDHHFTLPKDGTGYSFLKGDYVLEIFATLVGKKAPVSLQRVSLSLTEEQAAALMNERRPVSFDWSPDLGKYHAAISQEPGVASSRLPTAPAMPIDRALKIDFLARDGTTVVFKDQHTDIQLFVRVLNAADFPVKLTGLFLRWEISILNGFRRNDTKDVADRFGLLEPGDDQVLLVNLKTDPVPTEIRASHCMLYAGGYIVASAEEWGGSARAELASPFTWAAISDQRKAP